MESTKDLPEMNIRNLRLKFESNSDQYQIQYDLVDSGLTLCSQEVLNHFMENFDYHNFDDDFVNDLLTSEILDDRILVFELSSKDYSVKIQNYRIYEKVSRDIINQWTYPITLGNQNLKIKDKVNYNYFDSNKYIAENVKLPVQYKLGSSTVIGNNTQLGENIKIKNSVIGQNCKIGQNVIITDSIIWDNVQIMDNCSIQQSLICHNVVVGLNTILNRGTVLSHNVEVKNNQNIAAGTIVSLWEFLTGDNQTPYKYNKISQNSSQFENGAIYSLSKNEHNMNRISKYEMFGGPHDFLEKLFDDNESLTDSDSEQQDDEISETEISFKDEVAETIQRGTVKNSLVMVDNIIIEINSLKFAENKSFQDCIESFMPPILDVIKQKEGVQVNEMIQHITNVFKHWSTLFIKFMHDNDDVLKFIEQIEDFCNENDGFKNSFHIILQITYKLEILNGSQLLSWADQKKASNDSLDQHNIKLTSQFMEFLKNQQEDDDDDDSDEDDDSEESD